MDTSYAWHPGSHGVDARWLKPVALQPDELFSTWLARAALAQGCDPLTLTGTLWPGWRAWTLDLDRCIDADRLAEAAGAAGVDCGVLSKATLRGHAAVVAGDSGRNRSVAPWMLATGARNRQRRAGLAYCPLCLASDRHPYFRIQWRFAWHTTCSTHGLALCDRCPRCGAPPEPHRLLADARHLALCARCGFDLTTAVSPPASPAMLAFQGEADRVVRSLRGRYGAHEIDAPAWFQLARFVIGLVRTAALGKSARVVQFVYAMGVDASCIRSPATGLSFELIPVHERASLIEAAWCLLTCEPSFFVDAAESVGARDAIARKTDPAPPAIALAIWQWTIDRQRRDRRVVTTARTPKPRSRESVERAWARFRRKYDLP